MKTKYRKRVRNIRHAVWLANHGWMIYGSTICKFESPTVYTLSERTRAALIRRNWLSGDAVGRWTWNWRRSR